MSAKSNTITVANENSSNDFGLEKGLKTAIVTAIDSLTVNTDEYLALNKYEVDEANAHIELIDNPSEEEFLKLVRVCPAALYKIDAEGKQSFDYAGCLECGTCRIACGDTIIAKWENPQPTMGIIYRYG
ncbi:MAG: ferredoxin family protein [Coriobacteriales bacterium]|jgi:ferredoxin-like protein FixX|nr:ferredoxin family protein [Coriobacteriales bacterium]